MVAFILDRDRLTHKGCAIYWRLRKSIGALQRDWVKYRRGELMVMNTEAQPKRTGLLVWMIVSQVLTLASLLIWLLVAGLSVMAFDSGVTKEAWTIVIAVWSYPIIPIVLVIAAWIAYARRRNKSAAILSGLSFAPPFLLYIGIFAANVFWSATH